MSRWLQFSERNAGSGSGHAPPVVDNGARPAGELLWCHATSEPRLAALIDFGARLRLLRAETRLLITVDGALSDRATRHSGEVDLLVPIKTDGSSAARQFIKHWTPDLCIWTGGNLRLNLVAAALDHRIPLILADAEESELESRKRGWFSDPVRTNLSQFRAIMVRDEKTANALLRLGVSGERLIVTPPFRNGRSPAPFSGEDPSAISANLTGRPIWLASQVQPGEVEPVLTAHRNALRLAHRLLLVLTPADQTQLPGLRAALETADLRHTTWHPGLSIEEYTQVIISEDAGDLDLWYRISPLTFLASSLLPETAGIAPFEAAALGSAILHGPYVGDNEPDYSRLGTAGASRLVRDAESLGTAVVQLSAPDQAAAMALAGWEAVTEGADTTDRLLDLVQDMLDSEKASHARA